MADTLDFAEPAKGFTPYQKFAILILALTQFTVLLDFMVMSPLGDMLMKSMDMKPYQFGIALSGYAFSACIAGFLTAGFADKFDRKKLLLFFYIGFIAGTFICGLTTTYSMLVAARIVTGLFGGVIGSISMAIVADLFPLEKRGRVMGFMQMGFGASQVLGIPISLFIANRWGWQMPFIMIAVLAAVTWLAILLKMKPITEHLKIVNDRNPIMHLWHTITNRNYRVGFTATALLSLGGFMMMPWGSAFSINNLHVTKEQLPLLFMVAGISTLVIMPLIGKLSDKVDKFRIFLFASIYMIIMVLIYTNLTPVPFWVVLMMNILFMIGIMSRMIPASAITMTLPEMHDRGAFMSISSSLQQFTGGLAAIVSGMIVVQKDKFSPLQHYDTLGIIISVITVVSIFMLLRVDRLIKANRHRAKL